MTNKRRVFGSTRAGRDGDRAEINQGARGFSRRVRVSLGQRQRGARMRNHQAITLDPLKINIYICILALTTSYARNYLLIQILMIQLLPNVSLAAFLKTRVSKQKRSTNQGKASPKQSHFHVASAFGTTSCKAIASFNASPLRLSKITALNELLLQCERRGDRPSDQPPARAKRRAKQNARGPKEATFKPR